VQRVLAFAAAVLAAAASATAQPVRSLPVNASDLVYSPLTGRLYASVTATNNILVIDPVAGVVTGELFGPGLPVFDQPNKLAISEAGDVLYIGVDGVPGVLRLTFEGFGVSAGAPFQLGTPDPIFGVRAVEDLAVLPGNANAFAVARQFPNVGPGHAGVAVYDTGVFASGVERSNVTAIHTGSNVIAFGATAGRLYGYNNETTEFGFRRMDVTASGVTVLESTTGLIEGHNVDIEYSGGRIYATTGRVIDPEARTIVTTLPGLDPFDNLVEPTASAIYYLTRIGADWRLKTYDPSTLAGVIDGLVPGVSGTPRSLVKAGTDTLAFATSSGQVFLLRPSLLPATDPTITITGPTEVTTLTVESSSITLTGTTVDPTGAVVGVAWSTNRGYAGAANGTAAWTAGDIPLLLGTNEITVQATDDTGQTSTDTIAVTVPAFTAFLAEGSTGTFFDYDMALANPSLASVDAEITYFTSAGATVTQSLALPAQSRRTIKVDEVPGLAATALSASVRTTTAPIVVERTTRWGPATEPQYGAHGDKSTAGAALKWYFAEGSQGFFHTFLLLANPGDGVNTATVDWLIEGGSPVQRVYILPAHSRTTIYPGDDANVAGHAFGIVVTFAQPAVAERAMYFGMPPDVFLKAGHDSAGVTAPSPRWFFAEGATGPFFQTFILLANPNPTPATATLRFITQDGVEVTRTVPIGANGRRTVDIEALNPIAPELANAAVATVVTATQPIVAERAQYWPGDGSQWYEAHNSFGSVSASRRWGLAEGRVGNPTAMPPASYQTYVLLANPATVPANVTITFLRESGAPVVRSFTVAAGSRRNVAVAGPGSDVPELANELFGAVIDADQPIVVERALYGDAGTQVFGIGTNATATPLP
jgi:hypothetical protein